MVEAPLTVAAPPAFAAAILRSTTAGAAGVKAAPGEAPASTCWPAAATGSLRTKAALFCPDTCTALAGAVTGRLPAAGAGFATGVGLSAVGGVNWGPDGLTTPTGLLVARGRAGLAAAGAWPGCEATEVGGAPVEVAAPPLTAAVKFRGAAVGVLLTVGLVTAGSLVAGPVATGAGLEF